MSQREHALDSLASALQAAVEAGDDRHKFAGFAVTAIVHALVYIGDTIRDMLD